MQINKVFTIIIPMYNAEKTIERTLASLISNKNFIYEVIIVDDHSTDNSLSKISVFEKFFPIRCIQSEGIGNPGAARKTGILNAKSEWITFLDADDCLTSSCLYYVIKQIQEDTILLHTQQIYYESGNFNKNDIDFSIHSCGGNFYKLQYLIDNNLLPHDELSQSQDEYFNKIIISYINFYDNTIDKEKSIKYFQYPTYEVHHDIEEYTSYSFENWADYLCKYHLLCDQYIIEFFENKKVDLSFLKNDLIEDFIFVFFLTQALILDRDIIFDLTENAVYFKNFLIRFNKIYNTTQKEIINYYYNNPKMVKSFLQGAFASSGIKFKNFISFKNFVNNCLHDKEFQSTNFYRSFHTRLTYNK